jgi:class 3 adenylate cyclase
MTDLGSGDARIRELTRELSELRDRHEAVARVLHDLARSQMRLQPILDQIAEAMASLLRSEYSLIHLTEGDLLHFRAHAGVPAAAVEYERLHPVEPGGVETLTGRVALTKQPVHIRDVVADADYNFPAVKLAPARTLLGAPVLIEDELVGVMQVGRRGVRPFDDGEIELMATFANQCAIAIGNARLFETVERQRAHLARFVSPEVAALVSSEGSRLLAGHRAYISVAYFDLRGFTAFVETAEPEELIDVVREYHQATGQLVAAHEGTLEHFAGDGLMVFFNDPVPLPDHELHATKLAVAMRERVGELADGWRKRGHELGLGAGIATGHATLGQIGFEGRYDYGVLGPVTNLAARLSDAAAAGQILLSQRTFSALEDLVEARPAVQLEIKGFSRSVQVYELLRVVET